MITQALTVSLIKHTIHSTNINEGVSMKVAVYEISNTINNKVYIGVSNNPTHRLHQHKSSTAKDSHYKLHMAMRKHGFENFKLQILCWLGSRDEASKVEIALIESRNSRVEGYNTAAGGEGGIGSGIDNHRYGKKLTPEHIQILKDSNHKRKGIKLSEEVKASRNKKLDLIPGYVEAATARIIEARKLVNESIRKKNAAAAIKTPEVRAKLSAALKGVPKSKEHAAKVGAAQKGILRGPQSEEHKEARSRAVKEWWAARKASAAKELI